MKINHLIVGTTNVEVTADFYCELLQFVKTNEDPGAPNGMVLKSSIANENTHLLLIPFKKELLPNPLHVAFECHDEAEFKRAYSQALKMNLQPRSAANRSSTPGYGEFTRSNRTFKQFYVADPNDVNVEVMF
ncbi:MAG: VOC family protein [Bdellovibrionales bacterium]|nr:VOC family protein [Bdellovibrionales bacterium]